MMPYNLKIVVNNQLTVTGSPPALAEQIRNELTLRNPAFIEAVKRGRWLGNIPEYLHFFEEVNGALILPRGFCRQLITMCRARGISYEIDDQRRTLGPVDFQFTGALKPFQAEAVSQILKRDFGTLSAPTGSGKTVMALAVVAARRQPCLIVVHTRELLQQWVDRIETFLSIPSEEVGVIGNGRKRVGEKITVALVQSLYKCAHEVAQHIGFLVVDECHRAPSRTFSEAVTAFDSKFMLGLSATPYRRDGLSKLIYWALGDIVHEVDKTQLLENGDILQADVIIRETDFTTCLDASEHYSQVLSELTQDHARNLLMASDIASEARNGGGVALVLSDRKSHCQALQTILSGYYSIKSDLLIGDLPKKQRQAVVDRLNAGKIRVLIATSQLLSEGFDSKNLSTLFLATPIKFSGRLLQCVGRILRPGPGKTARVYDYVDIYVGVLKASAKARGRIYDLWAK